MAVSVMAVPGVTRAANLVETRGETGKQRLTLDSLRGRLSEIVVTPSSPALSVVSMLIFQAQQASEPVVWIEAGVAIFYPPDFADNGVDLAMVPVVWSDSRESAIRAAEHLLRSAAFGMILIDCEVPGNVKPGRLGTLNRLCALHETAVVFLNHCGVNDEQSLGSLISLRLALELEHPDENRFVCRIRAVKDRRHPRGWVEEVTFRGTDGLY